jgi:Fe-coproporphyrin III synthase
MNPLKTLVVHPTLKCNLACKHCYSASSPEHTGSLDQVALKNFLSQAKDEGYNYLAFSGGEPLLYKFLPEVLMFSKQLGYTNAITTNGMLLKSNLSLRALEYIDLVNVSIDGNAHMHNHIRGQHNAFEKMMEGVHFLRDNNRDFGFSHTICYQDLSILDFIENLALENNAQLLQFNKLSNFGRALDMELTMDSDENAFQAQLIDKFQSIFKKNYTHFYTAMSLTTRQNCLTHLAEDFHRLDKYAVQQESLAACFSALTVNEQGDVLPFGYNVAQKHAFHNILSKRHLKDSIKKLKDNTLCQSQALLTKSIEFLYQNDRIHFANATNIIEFMSQN